MADPASPSPSPTGHFDADPAETLSPLEQEVLDEYARLLGNLNDMSDVLGELAARPTPAILDAMRGLERKTSLVFTLLKASVYSILLTEQMEAGGGEEQG